MRALIIFISLIASSSIYAMELSPDNLVSIDSVYPSSTQVKLVNKFGLRYGTPSENQIYDISTMEMFWQFELPRIPNTILLPSAEMSVSKLLVGEMHGVIWGAGLAYKVPILNTNNRLSFDGATKVHYLSRHDFERKRYGGPVHFSYRFGMTLKVVQNIDLSYSWQHMSNADRYDYNPSLETHTLSMELSF